MFLGYDFGKGWSVGCEIEFEHSGGEVAIEQFWLQKKLSIINCFIVSCLI